MLTDDDWKLATLTIDPAIVVNNVAISNYYSQLYDYDKDNLLRFFTDGTFTSDEGALKAHPDDPQTVESQWLLAASEHRMTVWNDSDTIEYGIPSIDTDNLILTYTQRDTATPVNYTLTAGFTH